MKFKLFLLVILFIGGLTIAGYFLPNPVRSFFISPMQSITLTTPDGVILAGNYLASREPKGAVLLLHMMPATKESWEPLQQALEKVHISSLAIDLRGHRQSTKGPADIILDYNTFTDREHQLTRNDVTTSIEYLVSQGFTKNKIVISGASIGANLAIQELSQDPEINSAILLSPGLDYHGIETEQYARSLADVQALFTIASRDDGYSFDSSRRLYDVATIKKDIGEYDDIGHGTTMLENKPELIDTLVAWIVERMQ
ncbi:MAG: alpha/beta fold hydrolase [bacterium]|nr:alpha/beta fold hydrolase [bacterium]